MDTTRTMFGTHYVVLGQVDGLDISYGIFSKVNPIYIVKNEDDISIYPSEHAAKNAYTELLRKILRQIQHDDDVSPW